MCNLLSCASLSACFSCCAQRGTAACQMTAPVLSQPDATPSACIIQSPYTLPYLPCSVRG